MRDHRGLFEVRKWWSVVEYLKGDPILSRDVSNINVGIVLSPDNGILMETVDLWKEEGVSSCG